MKKSLSLSMCGFLVIFTGIGIAYIPPKINIVFSNPSSIKVESASLNLQNSGACHKETDGSRDWCQEGNTIVIFSSIPTSNKSTLINPFVDSDNLDNFYWSLKHTPSLGVEGKGGDISTDLSCLKKVVKGSFIATYPKVITVNVMLKYDSSHGFPLPTLTCTWH